MRSREVKNKVYLCGRQTNSQNSMKVNSNKAQIQTLLELLQKQTQLKQKDEYRK